MNRVFKFYLDKFLVVFIDDILVYSMDRDEHTTHLRAVLQTLREHQLYGKLKKYEGLVRRCGIFGTCSFQGRD